uniref:Cytoskeleton-associated protein 2 n=1 Tax=Ciona intestinalis TaxID=7719 RepID=F7B7C2_CIOIN|nr:cytoskeleton-associated protein 2 [Ciona intestinalis]|eukprot:XP_002126212.1 cytoskeleton-associated protein 2 [Ciona intestinalis]
MDAERLAKLNAYLISKGKKPKELSKNYIKANATNVKRGILTKKCQNVAEVNCTDKATKKSIKMIESTQPNLPKTIKRLPSKTNKAAKTFGRKSNLTNQKIRQGENKFNATKDSMKHNDTLLAKTPTKAMVARNLQATPMSSKKLLSQKLLRRSMGHAIVSKENCTPKKISQPMRTPVCKSVTGRSILSKSVQPKSRVRTFIAEQRSKAPAPKKRLAKQSEREERMLKLKAWLISRGKSVDHLRGFKPAKTMLTPVNSPQQKTGNSRTSYWPRFREEDYQDEISILMKHAMQEATDCLNENCSPTEVHQRLVEFREKIPSAEQHAIYWITMAAVYEKLGKSNDEILNVYETAVDLDAQPLEQLKVALNEFISKPPKMDITPSYSINEQGTSSPTTISQRTSPIRGQVFQTPIKSSHPPSPLVAGSPSSVIKLRMISKSSPVFKQILLKRALPLTTSAIVTPVRRSKRIENASSKYPQYVRPHHPCITNPQDLLESMNKEMESCDFVFDENKALGEDYADVSTILNLG